MRLESPIRIRRGRELRLGFDETAVAAIARRDGQAGFNTARWGSGNRQLWGLRAVLAAVATQAAAVRTRLDEVLGELKQRYAHEVEVFQAIRLEEQAALVETARAAARRRELRRQLKAQGLNEPRSQWRALVFLGLLVIGDLAMTSAAMAIFNLSDRRYVEWLPFSDLERAALPVVVATIGAAHWVGQAVVRLHYDQRARPVWWFVIGTAAAALLALVPSVAVVRTDYLSQMGIPAATGAFVGIQAGFALVAIATTAATTHPFAGAWQASGRAERQAVRTWARTRRRVGRQAAMVNAVVRAYEAQVAAARSGVETLMADGTCQAHLYMWEFQHAQPEPTTEALLEGELPTMEQPAGVQELLDHSKVAETSTLRPPSQVDLTKLDAQWARLQPSALASLRDEDFASLVPPHTGTSAERNGERVAAGGEA